MTFAPFGLTLEEWVALTVLVGAIVTFIRKVFIPWHQKATEEAIASDRGIRAALVEVLPELQQVSGLKDSVEQLTRTIDVTNLEHRATRHSFAEIQKTVADLRTMVETELGEMKRRMNDVERGQEYYRRASDRVTG